MMRAELLPVLFKSAKAVKTAGTITRGFVSVTKSPNRMRTVSGCGAWKDDAKPIRRGTGGREKAKLCRLHRQFSSAPEVGLGEVDDLIAPAADHSFQHVECESLGHLQGDGWWHRELCPVHD